MGNSLYLEQSSHGYVHLCNLTQNPMGASFMIPPDDIWWACAPGLTPYVNVQVLDQTKDSYILVQLVPRIVYYPDNTIFYPLKSH